MSRKVQNGIALIHRHTLSTLGLIAVILAGMVAGRLFAQVDQGTITGVVQDTSGAVIPNADVTLSNTDTGLVLTTKSNGSGVYVFSPIKIGNYTVSASAPNFQKTLQQNLTLHLSQTLNVPVTLKPGSVSETVTVSSAPPLLENQQATVSQTFSSQEIESTPLAERNWVYMAQLSTGVVPSYGTRGGSHGDYEANGQRAEQNDYILDGVDNNVNIVDYMNGTLYAVSPPPDALSEFKLDTTAYSAQYGHSAGSVLNVAIRSGTNGLHGDVWEYNRNTALNAVPWNANSLLPNPPYHFNQFGATLGFPILHNKLFYFGDIQGTRIALASVFGPIATPTPRMRQGDFSELLTPANTGGNCAVVLYQPNSNTGSYSCNGTPTGPVQQYGTTQVGSFAPGLNVFNPATLDPVAKKILQMYPLPNANGWNSSNNTNSSASGTTFNNLVEDLPTTSNTVQWDQRLDWNIRAKDSAYTRYSYSHMYNNLTPPLGTILDGTTSFAGKNQSYTSENFMISETHLFSPNLINEFRFGYNWGNYQNLQPNFNTNEAANLGLGGMPFSGPGYFKNGGLPSVSISGIQAFGSHGNDPSIELQNIYQILDNVTKVMGNHTVKAGVSFQNFRIFFLQPPAPRGSYSYTGKFTGVTSVTNTGNGVADFLVDQMASNSTTNEPIDNLQDWYDAAYAEDTWKATPRLTVTYGVRWDYYQPTGEMYGGFANFVPLTKGFSITSKGAVAGTGTADYVLPAKWQNVSNLLAPSFTSLLAANNVTLTYDSNPRLSTAQKTNFAPRVGVALQVDPRTVFRAGGGIFYGAIFGLGSNPNIGGNYPFMIHSGLGSTNCAAGNPAGNPNNQAGYSYCPALGATTVASSAGAGQPGAAQNYPSSGLYQDPGDTLETGMGNQINGPSGIKGFINSTVINGRDPEIKTPYVINYDLSVQRVLTNNMSATIMYVGNVGRHQPTLLNTNAAAALQANGANSTAACWFPSIGCGNPLEHFGAESMYNSLQAKLEKRFSNGLSYLASYTWSHNLDNSVDPLGGGTGYRMWQIIPIKDEITNSNYDVRSRFTFNGSYQLPFGKGRTFMNSAPKWMDEFAGGWTSDLTFTAQTGIPFTVGTSGISTPSGQGSTHAILVFDPYRGGGNANNPTNPQLTSCPGQVHTRTHWYNACAFNNPLNGAATPNLKNGLGSFPSTPVTDAATAMQYLGGKSNTVYGPGFERINMSLSKDFSTRREQYLQLRADTFNLFNHPSWSNPQQTGLNNTAGLITSPVTFQSNVPDARIFQLSAKYVF